MRGAASHRATKNLDVTSAAGSAIEILRPASPDSRMTASCPNHQSQVTNHVRQYRAIFLPASTIFFTFGRK